MLLALARLARMRATLWMQTGHWTAVLAKACKLSWHKRSVMLLPVRRLAGGFLSPGTPSRTAAATIVLASAMTSISHHIKKDGHRNWTAAFSAFILSLSKWQNDFLSKLSHSWYHRSKNFISLIWKLHRNDSRESCASFPHDNLAWFSGPSSI